MNPEAKMIRYRPALDTAPRIPLEVSFLLFAGLLLATLASAPAARACTCMPPGPPLQELEKADAVFSGRVLTIEPQHPEAEDAPIQGFVARLRVTLEVDKVWKGLEEGEDGNGNGNGNGTVQLLTASQSAMCGYSFTEGERYLVYAYRSRQQEDQDGPEVLTATLCSRTAPLERAEGDLEALGEPQEPQEPQCGGSRSDELQ